MFNIRSIDDFKKAFLLVDEYMAVKKTCFSDIDIKLPENESDPKLPNYVSKLCTKIAIAHEKIQLS